MGNNKCPICGKETNRGYTFCSVQCRAEAAKNYKQCIVCGKYFWCSPSEAVLCCGPVCSKLHRSSITKNREGNDDHIKNQSRLFAQTHGGHLNPCAKHYGIITPRGDVVDVLNLRDWVYHSGFFDNPQTAYNALLRVVGTFKGTVAPKRRLTHYAGYSIAYCDDGNVANSRANRTPKKHCKICGAELPSIKRSYCSDECANIAHNQSQKNRYRKKRKKEVK